MNPVPVLALALLVLQTPESIITKIGVDPKLGAEIDAGIVLRNEAGDAVRLGEFFRAGKPVILTPVYFECPMLCTMQLNGLLKALRVMPLTVGEDFEIVSFSIDPNEGPELASAKKQHYIRDYGKPKSAGGWHFLTAETESIARLTDELGFRYTYDTAIKQWAHASALIVLTPDRRISQYFYGIEYDPGDLKLSLVEASGGKIGSFVDRALLYCYQYNPSTGTYSLTVLRLIRVAGVATVMGLVLFIVLHRRT